MGEVVPAGGVVVVDEGGVTVPPASQLRKKLMPVLTLKPSATMSVSTNNFPPQRKPNIGNLCIRTKRPEERNAHVEVTAHLPMVAIGKDHLPLYPKPVPNVQKSRTVTTKPYGEI